MEAFEDTISKKQEDLSLVVEPLVDSISELVLTTVTGSYETVQTLCTDISDRTNKLVIIAQQVAVSSTDGELQREVANSINALASAIEALVTTFAELLGESTPKNQERFAKAAKDVGDAINRLCSATDLTSQQKILEAVHECAESAKAVAEAALTTKEQLIAAAQINSEKTVKLVKVATLAASSTADQKKKSMLIEGASNVKVGCPALIQAARSAMENPRVKSYVETLTAKGQALGEAFSTLINAAKLSPNYYGKMSETYEYVKKLIDMAKSLEEAANELYTVTKSGSNEQFLEAAKLTAQRAALFVQQGEAALKAEKDPVKKQLIQAALVELREASNGVIQAAKYYREHPNDPAAKAKLDQAHQRLEAAIRGVVAATGMEQSENPRTRLAMAATALEAAALNVVNAAKSNPATLVEQAQILAGVAIQVAKEIEAVAEQTTDPAEKKRLLENANEIKTATQRVIAAAKRVAQNPNDQDALNELAQAHKALLEKINVIRKDAHLAGPDIVDEEETVLFSTALTATAGTERLVSAAKDEATAALHLAEEADRMADSTADPVKKQKLKAAVKDVKLHSANVVQYAELVKASPHDPSPAEKLNAAQKDLGTSIQKVVDIAADKEKDIADAMAEMKIADKNQQSDLAVLASAQKVLDEIAAAFGGNKSMTPQEVIENAKNLSARATDFAKQLREMAAQTSDPIFKEKLNNAAKIIRDGAVQIKILSAVQAAGGDGKTNAVGMSAKGLQTNIQDIMSEIKAETLRTRFKNTVKTTVAINKVVKVWKAKAQK